MYEDLVRLIERSRVDFPNFGDGLSVETIAKAEADLGYALPVSYKWWLLNYGGGQIQGDIVYGLDEGGTGRPDVVELARLNAKDDLYDTDKLVFYIGNEMNFYFDLKAAVDGEYAVFCHDIAYDEARPYANSFAEFLRLRLGELMGDAEAS